MSYTRHRLPLQQAGGDILGEISTPPPSRVSHHLEPGWGPFLSYHIIILSTTSLHALMILELFYRKSHNQIRSFRYWFIVQYIIDWDYYAITCARMLELPLLVDSEDENSQM